MYELRSNCQSIYCRIVAALAVSIKQLLTCGHDSQ